MGGELNKLLFPFNGMPVLAHSLSVFQQNPMVDRIIIASDRELTGIVETICRTSGITKAMPIVEGGRERQDSVLSLLRAADGADIVAVHDGARPLLTSADLQAVLDIPDGYDGAVLGVPVKDTLKEVDPEGQIVRTPQRHLFWAAHTPQVFYYTILLEAYEKASRQDLNFTDDSAAVEHYGGRVRMVRGSCSNIKLTTQEDLTIADAFFRKRADNGRS